MRALCITRVTMKSAIVRMQDRHKERDYSITLSSLFSTSVPKEGGEEVRIPQKVFSKPHWQRTPEFIPQGSVEVSVFFGWVIDGAKCVIFPRQQDSSLLISFNAGTFMMNNICGNRICLKYIIYRAFPRSGDFCLVGCYCAWSVVSLSPKCTCVVNRDARPVFPSLGTLSSVPCKIIKNFLISTIFRYYFKSVLLVIVMSVCGFYKYLTNEKHSKELVTKTRNAIGSSNCQ